MEKKGGGIGRDPKSEGDRVILYATKERREIVGEFIIGDIKSPLGSFNKLYHA